MECTQKTFTLQPCLLSFSQHFSSCSPLFLQAAAAARINPRWDSLFGSGWYGGRFEQAIESNCVTDVTDCLTVEPACVSRRSMGSAPLMIAIKKWNFEFCDLLLRCGADVNAKDDKTYSGG
jgi:hypothetical protein